MSNFKPEDWKQVALSESFGSYGGYGIQIRVATTSEMPDLTTSEIWTAVNNATTGIVGEIKAAVIQKSPEAAKATANNRKLIELFPSAPIFVEEIPNGYCSDYCCRHLPWFVITTTRGRIKIGARKRVINIDWEETVGTAAAEVIFPDEAVTKGYKYIHAWDMKTAKRYIEAILLSEEPPAEEYV